MGENETGWGNQGHADLIMDNLIAEGKTKPFIIVMDNSSVNFPAGGRPGMEDVNNTPGFKEKVKLVFVSYGSRELENRKGGGRGPFGGDPKANSAALKEAGINCQFYVSPLTAHEWQSWRRSLHEFASLLFKD
jgi:enterochelin esterase family protein